MNEDMAIYVGQKAAHEIAWLITEIPEHRRATVIKMAAHKFQIANGPLRLAYLNRGTPQKKVDAWFESALCSFNNILSGGK